MAKKLTRYARLIKAGLCCYCGGKHGKVQKGRRECRHCMKTLLAAGHKWLKKARVKS